MNKQGRLVLALAMIGLALYIFQQSKNNQQQQEQQQQVASVVPSEAPKVVEPPKGPNPREFLVAKQNLDPALITRITTDLVETKVFPENVPVPDPSLVIKNFDQIGSKILVSPVAQGELLMRTRFADARTEVKQKMLRDVIPNGFRAITVDVDAQSSSGGFINQGDIVDIMATYTAGGRQLTRIIIQNVEVLARGTQYLTTNRPSGERVIRGDAGGVLFTLKVKPEMAIKLAHIVDERGFNRFKLVLKNRDDKQQLFSQGVLLREVLTDKPRSSLRPGQLEPPPEVEVLRGATVGRDSTEERGSGPPPEGGPAPAGPPASAGDLASRITPPGEGGAIEPPPPPPPSN